MKTLKSLRLPTRFGVTALSILIGALLVTAPAQTKASFVTAHQRGVRAAGPATKRAARKKVKRKVSTKGATQVRAGTWGGRHIGINVTDGGAEIEYDCAHGKIDRRIELDAEGRFDVEGTFVPEGGPVSVPVGGGGTEKGFSARYRGRVEGGKMTLSVTITDTGNTIDEFSLTHGRAPSLEKCY